MFSLAALIVMLWATGTVLLLMYTEDKDQSPRAPKNRNKTKVGKDGRRPPSGMGGELSRLERKFEGGELEMFRAMYLADHPHHKDIEFTGEGARISHAARQRMEGK